MGVNDLLAGKVYYCVKFASFYSHIRTYEWSRAVVCQSVDGASRRRPEEAEDRSIQKWCIYF